MLVGIVNEQNIHPVELEAFEALLDRAHRRVVGEIEDRVDRRRALPRLANLRRRALTQKAPDLCGDDELIAWLGAQDRAEPLLGKAESVEGRGVEVADARAPCGLDHTMGLVFAHSLEQAAERRCAEPEPA